MRILRYTGSSPEHGKKESETLYYDWGESCGGPGFTMEREWAINQLFEKSKVKLKNRRCSGIILIGILR